MLMNMKHVAGALVFVAALVVSSSAQTDAGAAARREPTQPVRPFVVLTGQTLGDLERKLSADNKVEELYGGEGLQLRVAVQHDKNKPAGLAEVHDASDDVYYVLEGTATLTLGGRLDAPSEVQPGEWRGARIIGGQTFELAKGALIVVPRGTPHQRSTVGKDFSLILIKIFAEPVRPAAHQKPVAPGKEQKP